MPHEIAGVTTCNLPHPTRPNETCGQKFYGPQHLTIGAVNGGRVQALLEKMYGHLLQDHTQHFANIQANGEGLKGLLVMAAFHMQDPELHAQANHLRWTIHQQTLNARISDENILAAAARLGDMAACEAMDIMEQDLPDDRTIPLTTPAQIQKSYDLMETIRKKLSAELAELFALELRAIRDALQEPAEPPNPLAPAVATQ